MRGFLFSLRNLPSSLPPLLSPPIGEGEGGRREKGFPGWIKTAGAMRTGDVRAHMHVRIGALTYE